MIRLKSPKDITLLEEGGRRLARLMTELEAMVVPGIDASMLNDYVMKRLAEWGDHAAFYNYKPEGAKRPYPAALCVSVNHEVVHGIPNETPKILQDGDVVSLDLGLVHEGLITDHAVTLMVGTGDPQKSKKIKDLIDVSYQALEAGIAAAKAGNRVGDIGAAIEAVVRKHSYGLVTALAGHGVGYRVHEDPYVPNVGKKGQGELLKPGLVIAIEPMLTFGSGDVKLLKDGYTYVTRDGEIATHVEHTVVITPEGPKVLTRH